MKSAPFRSALFLALYYGTNAVYQGYMSKFYQQMGIDGPRLMLLLVSFPLFAALTQPFWGIKSDRMPCRNKALLRCIAFSALLIFVLSRSRGFLFILLISSAFAAFYPAIQPLSDSIILESLQNEHAPYGPLRLMGTLAFAASNLCFGLIFNNDYAAVPLIVGCGLLLTFLTARQLEKVPGHQHQQKKTSFFALLQCPDLKPLLALTMILQAALGYFFSYYSLYFTRLPGSSSFLLGAAYFIASISEIPFLLLGDRLFARFGAQKLLLLAALALGVRFLLIGLFKNVTVLFCTQALHGLGFIVITFSMAKFISSNVPPALRASGQMLLSIAGAGIARVIGIFVGSIISASAQKPERGFLWMGALCLLSFVIFLPKFLITLSTKAKPSQ